MVWPCGRGGATAAVSAGARPMSGCASLFCTRADLTAITAFFLLSLRDRVRPRWRFLGSTPAEDLLGGLLRLRLRSLGASAEYGLVDHLGPGSIVVIEDGVLHDAVGGATLAQSIA